jgi:hypothetical protein
VLKSAGIRCCEECFAALCYPDQTLLLENQLANSGLLELNKNGPPMRDKGMPGPLQTFEHHQEVLKEVLLFLFLSIFALEDFAIAKEKACEQKKQNSPAALKVCPRDCFVISTPRKYDVKSAARIRGPNSEVASNKKQLKTWLQIL